MEYFQVDAFTNTAFQGNPAAVYLLDAPLSPVVMQQIAREHQLSETAFVQNHGERWSIRWFTPESEVKLCGHATLAAAKVIADHYGVRGELLFDCLSGELVVNNQFDLISMDFPAKTASAVEVVDVIATFAEQHQGLVQGFNGRDWLVLLPTEASVRAAQPDLSALATLTGQTMVITAQGESVDFVSRFFAPSLGVPEDPVTGSAHCLLAPFWAAKLNRNTLTAQQLSPRGGTLGCRVQGDRVILEGEAVVVMQGSLLATPKL